MSFREEFIESTRRYAEACDDINAGYSVKLAEKIFDSEFLNNVTMMSVPHEDYKTVHRTLRAHLPSEECMTDIRVLFGIDAADDVFDALSTQITLEIEREVIKDGFNVSGDNSVKQLPLHDFEQYIKTNNISAICSPYIMAHLCQNRTDLSSQIAASAIVNKNVFGVLAVDLHAGKIYVDPLSVYDDKVLLCRTDGHKYAFMPKAIVVYVDGQIALVYGKDIVADQFDVVNISS